VLLKISLRSFLTLKQVRFKQQIEGTDNETVVVSITGQEQLTAGDIGKFTSAFQVLNSDLVICNMEPSVKLEMELTIIKGRGYIPAEENKESGAPFGTILSIQSLHRLKNVKYAIENYRVEQKDGLRKIGFDITTDGSIHPKEALKEAAKILFTISCYSLMSVLRLDSEVKLKQKNLMRLHCTCVSC
jgi:DNA-directed RNA polymerase subunit alpha